MNANQARKLMAERHSLINWTYVEEIRKMIEAAAWKGEDSITLDQPLNEIEAKFFKDEGFRYIPYDGYRHTLATISWYEHP